MYATTGDIVRFVKFRDYFVDVAERTHVVVSDLEFYLDLIGFEINSALKEVGFQVPVNRTHSPSGYEILRHLEALGAAALAEQAIRYGPETTAEHAKTLRSQFEEKLRKICQGEVSLIDVPGPIDLGFSGSFEDEWGREKEPFFRREAKF